MLNCDCYLAIIVTDYRRAKKKRTHFKMLSTKRVYKSYVFNKSVLTGFGIK